LCVTLQHTFHTVGIASIEVEVRRCTLLLPRDSQYSFNDKIVQDGQVEPFYYFGKGPAQFVERLRLKPDFIAVILHHDSECPGFTRNDFIERVYVIYRLDDEIFRKRLFHGLRVEAREIADKTMGWEYLELVRFGVCEKHQVVV